MSTLAARLSQLHHTEAEWAKIHDKFIPKSGEIIIYDPDINTNHYRIKIGDGSTVLKNLAYLNDNILGASIHYSEADDIGYIDSGSILSYKIES